VIGVVGALVLLAGFGWLWWSGVPALYRGATDISPSDRLKAVTDTRTALLAGLAALGALGTFWLNARTQRFTAESLRIGEANFRLAERSQQQTFELAERGHLTDRYTKAIEQLGDHNLDVRLGGIYALEQIATDAPRDRDQATIVEVLSAFVRVHSDPLYQYRASLPKDAQPEPAEEQRLKAADHVADRERPPVDVQAAVTVLGRLEERPGVARASLSWAVLRRVSFTNANLAGADLLNADLTGAFLFNTDLTGAVLAGADLTDAQLGGANLARATLTGANLTRADLSTTRGLAREQLEDTFTTGRTMVPAELGYPDSSSHTEGLEPE
jgi:hypothetical protein